MLYISAEALCKPRGCRGESKADPPAPLEERVIVWGSCSDEPLKGGWFFLLVLHMVLSTSSIKHWAPTFFFFFLLHPFCTLKPVVVLFSPLISTLISLLSPWVGGRIVVSMDQRVLTCQLFVTPPWLKMNIVHCPCITGRGGDPRAVPTSPRPYVWTWNWAGSYSRSFTVAGRHCYGAAVNKDGLG